MIYTVDNLLEFIDNNTIDDNTALTKAAASILNSLEQQIYTAAVDGQNYTQEADNFAVQTKTFNSEALRTDVIFSVNQKTRKISSCFEFSCQHKQSDLSIKLPKTILADLKGRHTCTDVYIESTNSRANNIRSILNMFYYFRTANTNKISRKYYQFNVIINENKFLV